MSIHPVDFNGMIQRTQDIGTVKHQEDMKPLIDQQNIQVEVKREEFRKSEQVQKKSDLEREEERYDAKEKGNGQRYQPNHGNRREREEERSDGKVTVKKYQGFDMKI